jgi:hypothetical protein
MRLFCCSLQMKTWKLWSILDHILWDYILEKWVAALTIITMFIVQVRTMNLNTIVGGWSHQSWAHNKSHNRNSNTWSIPSLSVRHTWLCSNLNRTKFITVEWPRWRLEFMSTMYHDNCSFFWYPVDVENSVRVCDSRLKNCDTKRTGIQTLRLGTSTLPLMQWKAK